MFFVVPISAPFFLLLSKVQVFAMAPKKHNNALCQTYHKRRDDLDIGYDLDTHENLTTPAMIEQLQELPIIRPGIVILGIGDHLSLNPPKGSIILSANVLKASILIPLLDFTCKMLGELKISTGNLRLTP